MNMKQQIKNSFNKTVKTFFSVLPIILGMLLLSSLLVSVFPEQLSSGIFGNGEFVDTLLAASIGSIAAGHPLASYLLGGELLGAGVNLIAVTALIVAWVTVGIVQLPAEALLLGSRFAVYRNLICFIATVIVAFLTVYSLRFLGIV